MESTTEEGRKLIFEEDYSVFFKWPEYLVFAAVLVASMGIGVFYGCFKKNQTSEDFLMGGRQMGVLPVTLSLVTSFISAVAILGYPMEVYFYGLVFIYFNLSLIPMILSLVFLYLPVFFRLQLTSAYEYFERRFDKRTRIILSVVAVVHLMLYMPLTVWGQALALDQVAGLDKYITSAVIFLVCIAYSSIGGLKAVLWSDALQALIIYGTVIAVIAGGMKEVGGFQVVWDRAQAAGRTNIVNFDFDPRIRHTFWTGLIGAYFAWVPLFVGTQAQIQRYLSVPTLRDARKCIILSLCGIGVLILLCILLGLLMFAKFHDCDPSSLDGQVISSSDQTLPLFVMHVLRDYPALPGLLVAGLTSGSLSSVSSALNALPAIIVEDYVKPWRPNLTDVQLGRLSKVISAVAGLLAFAFLFVIATVGNILPFAYLIHGCFLGPIVGVFSLGMFFPWANSLGSLLAVFPSAGIGLFFGVGQIMSGNTLPNQKLPLRTDGCYLNSTQEVPLFITTNNWKDEEYSLLTNLFTTSYLWQPLIPPVLTVIFGLIFSFIVNMSNKDSPRPLVKSRYLTPIILRFWISTLGKERVEEWVEIEKEDEEKEVDNLVIVELYENPEFLKEKDEITKVIESQ